MREALAVPVLMTIYPVAIVLILLSLLSGILPLKRPVFHMAILLTFAVSILDGYVSLLQFMPSVSLGFFSSILEFYKNYLPLYDLGLGWILPAALGAFVGALYAQLRKSH